MFVLLPLSDEGLPKDAKEKHEIIDTVYDRAMELGMAHEDIVVDGLVATIGANPEAAKECYDTISYCKDIRKLPTICGLSNISFLACRSGVLSIRHFLPWPSAGGLPWRLPIRRRNF